MRQGGTAEAKLLANLGDALRSLRQRPDDRRGELLSQAPVPLVIHVEIVRGKVHLISMFALQLAHGVEAVDEQHLRVPSDEVTQSVLTCDP